MGEKYIAPTPPTPESSAHRLLFNQTEEEIGYNETYLLNTTQTEKSYYYVPFIPGFDQTQYLDNRTVSPNATHYGFDKDFT